MRVYVHGNCQAPAIAGLLREVYPDWDIEAYEVFNERIIKQIDRYYHFAETADVIITQPIHDGYRNRADLSLSWLRSVARPSTRFVSFPSMFFDGQLVGCRSVKIPAFGMPYHDALLLHLKAAGVSVAEITDILLKEELYPESFIREQIKLSIDEMCRREVADGIDVPLSPFLEEFAYQTQLFHVINHPCRPALAFIANKILESLGFPRRVSLVGMEYIPFPHIPFLPAVRKLISWRGDGLEGWSLSDAELYHLPNRKLSPPDYYMFACEHLNSFAHAVLEECLSEPHVRTFLSRVARSMAWVPDIQRWL